MVAQELTPKLGTDVSLSFDRLFANDLPGRVRIRRHLVGSNIDRTKAAALAGLLAGE